MRRRFIRALSLGVTLTLLGTGACFAWQFREWKSGIEWPMPPIVKPGDATTAPDDAVVLFDGTDMSAWHGGDKWTIEDGYGIVGSGVRTKEKFGDCQLHLEFMSPPEVRGSGQGRGNSGIYFMGRYEMQILDSYENETYYDGQMGAIYKQQPPLVNACRPPGEWQTVDVIFTAPRFNEDGSVKSPAKITALHNGVLIHNNYELIGSTFFERPPEYSKHAPRESLHLQYHNDPVRFRNIWIRDLMPSEEETSDKAAHGDEQPSEKEATDAGDSEQDSSGDAEETSDEASEEASK